jgi:hypothetical protein
MPQTKATSTKAPAKKASTRAVTVEQSVVTSTAKVYKALKPLTVGNSTYAIGDIVVEAPNWLRLESWIMARWVEEV